MLRHATSSSSRGVAAATLALCSLAAACRSSGGLHDGNQVACGCAAGATSLRMQSEAADSMIAGVFAFQHVK